MRRTVIFFGMTGVGKSYLARAWSSKHGLPYWNTDVLRKQLQRTYDVRNGSGINQGLYSGDHTERTYEALYAEAVRTLRETEASLLVLDGSFMQRRKRRTLKQRLEPYCTCLFVFCDCDERIIQERLELRSREDNNVSDGNWDVYLHQKKFFDQPSELAQDELLVLNTGLPLEHLFVRLDKTLFGSGG